jgi:undecaprenyl-diphosphatase
VNPVDSSIVLWLNHFAGTSGTADAFVEVVSDNALVQAAVPVTILWYLWFRKGAPAAVRRTRGLIVATLASGCVGVLLARGLALVLPFRSRPFEAPGLGFRVMHSGWTRGLHDWSSFPSDHAVLFFALATGITLVSRRIGVVMLFYAAVVDCLPRIYLGFHYPSDIVAGALLGALLTFLAATARIREPLASRVLTWAENHPGLFYAGMFLCSFEIATMFDSALQMAQISVMLLLSIYRQVGAVQAAIDAVSTIPAVAYLPACGVLLIGGGLFAARRSIRGAFRNLSHPKPRHR